MTGPNADTIEVPPDDWDAVFETDLTPDSLQEDTSTAAPADTPAAVPEPSAVPALEHSATTAEGAPAKGVDPNRNPDGTFKAKPKDNAPVSRQQAASATAAAATLQGFTPPTGGNALTFRVDGEEVTPKGALAFPDGYWIPRQTWDREIRPHYLGSRNAWRQRERDLASQVAERERAVNTERTIADKIQAEVLALIESGPDGIAAWLQNYHQNAPVMMAQIEKTRAIEELAAVRAAQQEQQEAVHAAALAPRMQQWLHDAMTHTIKQTPELAVLGENPEELSGLRDEFWETYGQALFWEAEHADPARGIAQGAIYVNPDTLLVALNREAQKVQVIRDRLTRANAAAKANAAVIAPTVTAPVPSRATPPAAANGTPHQRASRARESFDSVDFVNQEFKDLEL